MPSHKTLLHCHSNVDPCDKFITYSTKELIDEAAKRKVSIMSLTSHKKVIFNDELKNYAASKGILLLPGVESQVTGSDVGIINAHADADHIKTLDDLRNYRKNHPESFIYAPHPYFPGPCLKNKLDENPELFDGIELSHFYHKYHNYNLKAEKFAEKHNLPFFATPDCHFLTNVDIAYTTLHLEQSIEELLKHKDPASVVISALKNKQFENHANPLSLFKISKTLLCHILWGNIVNTFKKNK
ncbi:MAG: PHP-associated domain-containing protein [Candidatus Gracilibacteria bacterium]|nr:PHP-associated domain-containing protein [Candidatus Gracilibacteria bacterium]